MHVILPSLLFITAAIAVAATGETFRDVGFHNSTSGTDTSSTRLDFHRTRDSKRTQARRRKTATKIERFVRDLKSYVSKDGFDYLAFSPQVSKMRGTLSTAEFAVETELDPDRFAERLQFARRFFQAMVDAGEKLKRYDRTAFPGYLLVRGILELNVRILGLFNSDGGVHLSSRVLEKVSVFSLTVHVLEDDFRRSAGVPKGMCRLFEREVAEAKTALRGFREASQIVIREG